MRSLSGTLHSRDYITYGPGSERKVAILRSETICRAGHWGLRHTFATSLTRAGVAPRIAQALMRHASLSTTMKTYTHIGLADQAKAVACLPNIEQTREKGGGC